MTSRTLTVTLHALRRISYLHRTRGLGRLTTPATNLLTTNISTPLFLINSRWYATRLKDELDVSIRDTLENLKQDCVQHSRVNFTMFRDLLAYKNIRDLKKDDVVFLLECCGNFLPDKSPTERMQLFSKLWEVLHEDSRKTLEVLKVLLKVHRENRMPIQNLEAILKESPFDMYAEIIDVCCEAGEIEAALGILADMKAKNLPITESVFNSLITGYSRCANLKECENTVDTMVITGITPSVETHARLLGAMMENGETEKGFKILKEKVNVFSKEQLLALIKTAVLTNNLNMLSDLFRHLPDSVRNDINIHPELRKMLIELINREKYAEIHTLLQQIPKPVFQSNQSIDTFATFVISEMIRSDAPVDKIIEICRELIESGKNSRALHIACEISLKREMEYTEELLRELAKTEELRCHYFWPLILTQFKSSQENGVLHVIELMKEFKVTLDYETLNTFVLTKLPLNLKDPNRMVKVLEEKGVTTAELMTPLVANLITQRRLKEAATLMTNYKTKIDMDLMMYPLIQFGLHMRINKNQAELVTFLAALSKNAAKSPTDDIIGRYLKELVQFPKMRAEFEAVYHLLLECKRQGVKISNFASDAVVNYMSRCMTDKIKTEAGDLAKSIVTRELKIAKNIDSSQMTHPRDMTFDELQCHLVELESKKLNPRGVLRRLLQIAVREGKIEKAVEYKARCEELEVNLSPGMLASILELNVRMKDLPAAMTTLKELGKNFPGFFVDDHKIIDLAALFVEKGDVTGAKTLLKNHAARTDIKGGPGIHKNIWTLLNHMALGSKNSDGNQTLEFLEFLCSQRYCTMNNNTLLGPVIREYILKYEINAAVEAFKTYAKKYKKSPLTLELMTILVKLSNLKELDAKTLFNLTPDEAKAALQDVITAASDVHGIMNVHVSLVFALADSGTEMQLRKFLINPQSKIDSEHLTKQCERLASTGKITMLLKLAKCSRGLAQIIKEDELYKIILSYFDRANNFKAALSLFDRLEEDDDFKISREFAKNLENLLARNSMAVPTKVLLRAN